MSLRSLDLTTALRPSLLPDETLLFVQNAVGLYAGKAKLADYQNGHAYLTTHRACYVDNDSPREKALAVNLRDVERYELYPGFLKSSPKLTLIPKSARLGASSIHNGQPSTARGESPRPSFHAQPTPVLNATWVCPICSFSNPVPSNFDPQSANANTPLPPCLACGIKPPLVTVIKAAVAGLSAHQRDRGSQGLDGSSPGTRGKQTSATAQSKSNVCPRCTFENHPSLQSCEICGAKLDAPRASLTQAERSQSASPAPANSTILPQADPSEGVKFAFRDGGEKTFVERLKGALAQRKWLLQSAPPPPTNTLHDNASTNGPRNVGIAGLERRGLEMRKNNEVVIGNAFEDLAALMASAKDIIALAEQFQSRSSDAPATQDPGQLLAELNLTTTREHMSSTNTNLYLTELARGLAEFLTDDRRGVLRSEGGVMPLADLWAVFNRTRSGVELVSPADLAAAADLFDKLSLPIRLRRFKSGLLVVQERSRTDAKTVGAILSWLASFRERAEVTPGVPAEFGRGVTVVEVAERFGWSVGVAAEELELAEASGALCHEANLEGARYWENWLVPEGPTVPATL